MDEESVLPPRYAIESDDEDEFNPLLRNVLPPAEIKVEITGNIPQNVNLIVVAGFAGKTWARGARLSDPSGQVSVNGVQIGSVYNPPWTTSNIIVSEELPLHAMHPYAETIIHSLNPSRVSLLDSYSVPTYATAHPVPFHEAPIRYLTTSPKPDLFTKAQLFAPPNLIQSTSASFLSILSLRGIIVTLILLPSPFIPPLPPKQISPSNNSLPNQDEIEWSPILIKTAHSLLFQALGDSTHYVWEYAGTRRHKSTSHRTEIGEGGMYI